MNQVKGRQLFQRIFVLVLLVVVLSFDAIAQHNCSRLFIIESIKKKIYQFYIDEETAIKMVEFLNKKKYGDDTLLNYDEFLFELTKDLRSISQDQHIVINSLTLINQPVDIQKINEKFTDKQLKSLGRKNKKKLNKINYLIEKQSFEDRFSYGEISVLPGNVGYVQIKSLNSANSLGSNKSEQISILSVFQKFKNTGSIIIDLRECLGGTTKMAARLSSFFSVELNDYFATGESILRYDSSGVFKTATIKKRYTTASDINNELTKNKKIYLLISKRTFSAAELTLYKIKKFLPEVLIIGEQTRGGANGYFGIGYDSCYSYIIPSEKIYDEKNNDYNFEGIGITPDIEVKADSALATAYKLTGPNVWPYNERDVKYVRSRTTLATSYKLSKSFFSEFAGNYRKAMININGDQLEMTYDELLKEVLIPVSKDEFQTETFSSIRFMRNILGDVTEIWIKESTYGLWEKFRKL